MCKHNIYTRARMHLNIIIKLFLVSIRVFSIKVIRELSTDMRRTDMRSILTFVKRRMYKILQKNSPNVIIYNAVFSSLSR